MASQDNEKAMDGLLRRSLARDASPKDECPNAELLAAYYERSLGADEIAGYDLHFAQCSRCREQLAAMVRAGAGIERERVEKEHALEPAILTTARVLQTRPAAATVAPAASNQPQLTPQRNARPGRSLIELRWFLPVAAALVLTALVYVRLAPRHPQVASILELEAPKQPAPPHLDPNAFDAFPKPAAPATTNPAAKKAPRSSSNQPAPGGAASAPARSGARGTFSARAAGTASASRSAAAPKSAATTATRRPALNSAEAGRTESSAEPAVAENQSPAATAPAAPPSNLNQAMATSVTSMDSAQAVASPAPPPPADSDQKSKSGESTSRHVRAFGASGALAKTKTAQERFAEIVIHSPDPKVLYRIASGGFIERSDDDGATWQGQLLNASAQFTAGSSSAPQVCWLVGRSGIIYRTEDGKNWTKIPSPAASDFTAVVGRNASSATVTAADGKSWATDDAGETWSPVE